jgi:SSS family solute:Na+ symporter
MIGWDIWICIIVAGVLVAAYTIVGGIDAVVWTDVIQTIVLVVGGVVVFCIVVSQIPGGLGEIISTATAHGKLSFSELKGGKLIPIGWGWAISQKTGLMMLILGVTWWLQEFAADQNVVQRYCAAASDAEAKKAVWWSVLCRLPIWAFFMFLGTALYVFFIHNPSPEAAAMLDGTKKAEGILPYFVMNHLPPGLAGLIIAAAIAAAMSSLDSSMNAISAVFVTDIYRTRIRKDMDEKHYLKTAKLVAAVAAVVMVVLAILLAYAKTKTIQDVSTVMGSILGGGLLGLFFFGFFTKWGDGRAAGCGIVATIIYTVYILLGKSDIVPLPAFDLYYTAIIGNVIMFGTSSIAAAILKRRDDAPSLTNLTVWTMEKKDDKSEEQ